MHIRIITPTLAHEAALLAYQQALAAAGVPAGWGIRFGKCPPKRLSGYLNIPFLISSNR